MKALAPNDTNRLTQHGYAALLKELPSNRSEL